VTLVVAHRGASRAAPENTLEAFEVAVALGADGVELDVHRTADGALVVHHDAAVPGFGVLADAPLAAIRAARPAVPTLDEALDVCRGRLVNVEVKNLVGDADWDPDDHAAELLVELLTGRGLADDVIVSSFNLTTVDRIRAREPAIATAFLTPGVFDPFDALDIVVDRGHAALHPGVRAVAGSIAGELVERAHAAGVRVNVWTVNDEAEIGRLGDAGVDAVVTDVPDVARRVLDRS